MIASAGWSSSSAKVNVGYWHLADISISAFMGKADISTPAPTSAYDPKRTLDESLGRVDHGALSLRKQQIAVCRGTLAVRSGYHNLCASASH